MARQAHTQVLPPTAVPGATDPLDGSTATLVFDRGGAIYENSSAETSGPYMSYFLRVTSSGGGTWQLPMTEGFRVGVLYRGDDDETNLLERGDADGDDPWMNITITGAGTHWYAVGLGTGGAVDLSEITQTALTATAPVPTTAQRFTLDAAKTPRYAFIDIDG